MLADSGSYDTRSIHGWLPTSEPHSPGFLQLHARARSGIIGAVEEAGIG